MYDRVPTVTPWTIWTPSSAHASNQMTCHTISRLSHRITYLVPLDNWTSMYVCRYVCTYVDALLDSE